jgi:fibronectin-binding autotransporter adhesin
VGNVAGNGDNRLIVSDNDLAGFGAFNASTETDLNNIEFVGWGLGANMIDLGGGLFEIVPSLEPFLSWDDEGSDNRWRQGNDQAWVNDVAPENNDLDQKIRFGDDAPDTAQLVEMGNTNSAFGDRTAGTIVFDGTGNRDYKIQSTSSTVTRTLNMNVSSGDAYITVLGTTSNTIGDATFGVDIDMEDNLVITSSSTADIGLTIGGDASSTEEDIDTQGNSLTIRGTGTTLVNSQIIGTGDLTKSGEGTLRLANNSNSYSGGTTFNDGVLQLAANGALGTGTLTIEGGTIEAYGADRTISNDFIVNDDFTVRDDSDTTGLQDLTLSGNGTISSGFQTLTVEDVTVTASGILSGAGELIKDGNGELVLTNPNNSFSGGFTLDEGTTTVTGNSNFIIGGANSYLGTGDVTLNDGSLNATISGDIDFDVDAGGTLAIAGGTHSIELTNAASDADINGSIAVTGGTTSITVGDDFRVNDGNITVDSGTLNINAGDSFTTDPDTTANLLEVTNGGQFNVDLSGNNTGNFTLGEEDTFRLSGATSAATIITDGNNVILDGTVRLNDQATLTVEGGTTFLGATTKFEGSETNPGTLVLNEGSLSINEPLVANRPNITFNHDTAQEITAPNTDSSILNLGTITKEGTGTLTINSNVNNIEAATINITGGTLLLGDSDQLANSNDMILDGGTFATGGNDEILSTLTLSSNSTIDMGSGSSILQYADGGDYQTGLLTIDNWSGTPSIGGGTDQIIFGQTLSPSFLSNVFWSDLGITGAIQLESGEIVPVIPEPSTIIGGLLLLLGVGGFEYRRRRKSS